MTQVEHAADQVTDRAEGQGSAPPEVEISRNGALAGVIALAGAVLAIGFLWRASGNGGFGDWLMAGLMGLVGLAALVGLVDARTPLLVADDLGVRIRLGREWRGLPWGALAQVVVERPESLLRDGRVVLDARDADAALTGLDASGRRQVALSRRWYGAPLAVPLAITTRSSAEVGDLVADLAVLADGRTDVVELLGQDRAKLDQPASDATARTAPADDESEHQGLFDQDADQPAEHVDPHGSGDADGHPVTDEDLETEPHTRERPDLKRAGAHARKRTEDLVSRTLARLGEVVSRLADGRAQDVDAEPESADGRSQELDAGPESGDAEPDHKPVPDVDERVLAADRTAYDVVALGDALADQAPDQAPVRVQPLRKARRAARADVTHETSRRTPVVAQATEEPEQVADALEPDVVEGREQVTDPEPPRDVEPVIGPDIAAARNRAGLSVDDLSERTLIRPHVIEAIEVDDFGPCGGDFYARGHLRTLARYLGLDQAQVVATYDERYSHAPINARRVFEAELAGGISGGIRSTSGGPRWSLLVGAVLCLLLVWGVARFFTDTPTEVAAPTDTTSDSAGLAANHKPITSPLTTTRTLTLKAVRGDSAVVVRDRTGKVVWSGTVRTGSQQQVAGLAPFQVTADHAASVLVSLGKKDFGVMGAPNQTATRQIG